MHAGSYLNCERDSTVFSCVCQSGETGISMLQLLYKTKLCPFTNHLHVVNFDNLDWPRLSYREQLKEGDEEADRGNDGKTTSKSGLTLNGIP